MPVRSSSSSVLRWPDAEQVKAAAGRWAEKAARDRDNIIRIGYFGSYARGDWGVGSDLDLIAIIASSETSFERRAAEWDTTDLPVPADIVIYTLEEWQKMGKSKNRRFETINKEAVWLYEKDKSGGNRAVGENNSENLNEDLSRDLAMLEAIEKDPNISQRDLSKRLGVALGITNSLIKTLVRKGHVKIKGKNNRSLTYHLTHAGVLHKSRLAMQWTINTFGEYKRLKSEIRGRLKEVADAGVSKAVIHGANELAEIAVMVASESGIEIIGVVDGKDDIEWVAGRRVEGFNDIREKSYDAIINCSNNEIPKDINKKVFELFSDHSWV